MDDKAHLWERRLLAVAALERGGDCEAAKGAESAKAAKAANSFFVAVSGKMSR